MADLFHIRQPWPSAERYDGGADECQANLFNLGTELFGELHQFFFVPLSIWPYCPNYPPPTANMKTTWKDIPVVPTSQEFLDIVLSRTQRRLPTQIRAGFKISRIRGATVS